MPDGSGEPIHEQNGHKEREDASCALLESRHGAERDAPMRTHKTAECQSSRTKSGLATRGT